MSVVIIQIGGKQ